MTERLVYLATGLPGISEELILARDCGDVLFMTGAGVSMAAPSNLPLSETWSAKKLDARLGAAMEG